MVTEQSFSAEPLRPDRKRKTGARVSWDHFRPRKESLLTSANDLNPPFPAMALK